jgi:GNAT superfamily N-acetyltransferase
VVVIAPAPFDSPEGRALTDAYHAFSRERFPEDFDPTTGLPALERDLVPPHGVFLVVRDDDLAIGCGGLRTLDAETAEIKHMFVQPSHRGRGIGGRILHALEAHGRDLGMTRFLLDTSEHLTEAIALYRRSGYVEVEPYNANHYATHWFEKRITDDGAPARTVGS